MCIMTEQPAGAGRKRLQDQGNGTCLDVKTGKLWQMAKSKRIKSLEDANLFIIPLDSQRRWYRYHHLFAAMLKARLAEEEPAHLPILHQRASITSAIELHGNINRTIR